MSFCKECGKELSAEAAFCPNCGTAVEVKEYTAETVVNTPMKKASKAPAIVGLVFSALSLSLCWMGLAFGIYAIFTIPFAIVGLVLSGKAKKSEEIGPVHTMGKVGKTLGIFGLIFSIIFAVIGFMSLIAMIVESM